MPLYYRDSSQPMLSSVVTKRPGVSRYLRWELQQNTEDHPSAPITLTLPNTANQPAARPPTRFGSPPMGVMAIHYPLLTLLLTKWF